MTKMGVPIADATTVTQSQWEAAYDGLHYLRGSNDNWNGHVSSMVTQACDPYEDMDAWVDGCVICCALMSNEGERNVNYALHSLGDVILNMWVVISISGNFKWNLRRLRWILSPLPGSLC